jgi:hypothetical protein
VRWAMAGLTEQGFTRTGLCEGGHFGAVTLNDRKGAVEQSRAG